MNQYVLAHLAIASSKQNEPPGALLQVLLVGKVSLTTIIQGCPLKGL